MVLTRVKERVAAILHHKAGSRDKVSNVFLVGLHGTKVFIAQTVFEIKFLGDLPGILDICVERVDMDPAFGITNDNCGATRKGVVDVERVCARRNVTGQKVGQGAEQRVGRTGSATRPRPSGTVENEFSSSAAVIELIEFAVAKFGSITELVLTDTVGKDVGKVQGQVASAFRRRQTN